MPAPPAVRRRRHLRSIALLAAVVAAGCAQASARSGAPTLSETWLVGGWVPEGESCESDAGMILNADRTWASEGVVGTWRIARDRIIMTATERDDGGPRERIVPPERHVQRVETVEQHAFVARHDDGTVIRWVRCPR